MEPIKTTTISLTEDESIGVNELPEELQGLVQLHDVWKTEERTAQLELHKVAMAIRGLQADISTKLREHLNPSEAETAEAATAAAPETTASA